MRQLAIGEIVARNARKMPDREAIVFEGRTYSYSDFDERTNMLANALLARYGKGAKVAELFFNCCELVESYIATAKMGGVSVPLNFRLIASEVLYQIQDSEARALIFGSEFNGVVEEVHGEMPDLDYFCVGPNVPEFAMPYEELLDEGSARYPDVTVYDDDDAFIMYTSGTTGKPKGAVLTHKNQVMNSINCLFEMSTELRWLDHERGQFVAPLFHEAALALALVALYMNATLHILRFFEPEKIMRQIEEEKITITFMPPVMSTFLLNSVDLDAYDTSTLRVMISGAAILPTETRRQLNKAFPNVQLFDVFGQTEMSPVTTILKPSQSEGRTASVGKPVINMEIRVVDDEDNDVAPGDVGEIIYRGPTVMKGYYKNPEATAETLRGGWFHSGDMVRVDDEGFVYVVDRKKDVIISGGENIYPAEVEDVIYEHPKVLECAVIGVFDDVWGEAVMAIVVPKPGEELDPGEIKDWCAANLAGFKKPKHIEFAEALPRNAAMKVVKGELRKRYGRSVRYE
jgi:fatty-acyl-CoA synthase